jgi:hypothetical protein
MHGFIIVDSRGRDLRGDPHEMSLHSEEVLSPRVLKSVMRNEGMTPGDLDDGAWYVSMQLQC